MKPKSVAADMENIDRDVGSPQGIQSEVANAPGHEEIRQRAYEIYVESGGTHGCGIETWLRAERELFEKHKAS